LEKKLSTRTDTIALIRVKGNEKFIPNPGICETRLHLWYPYNRADNVKAISFDDRNKKNSGWRRFY
jgi:hypothetical protein